MSRICPKCKIILSDVHNKCPRCGSILTDTSQKRSGQLSASSHGPTASTRPVLSELIGSLTEVVNTYLEENNVSAVMTDERRKYLASKAAVIILEHSRRVKGPDSEKPKYGFLPGETTGREVAIRLLKEHMDNAPETNVVLQGTIQGVLDRVMGMSEEEWSS